MVECQNRGEVWISGLKKKESELIRGNSAVTVQSPTLLVPLQTVPGWVKMQHLGRRLVCATPRPSGTPAWLGVEGKCSNLSS